MRREGRRRSLWAPGRPWVGLCRSGVMDFRELIDVSGREGLVWKI
jgi:hypothetical protein